MTAHERDALIAAFDSNWIAPIGPALDEFETKLAAATGTESCVGLVSGTAALHLACLLAGVGPGDTVVVPTTTFVASANAVRYVGAQPHFVDVEKSTSNMDPERAIDTIERLARKNTLPKAVMTVDLYGSCVDHKPIVDRCQELDIMVIEDAAEALGASTSEGLAGSLGDLGVISTNGNKLATSGGGGALLGPEELIDRARFLAGQAREPEPHYEHHELGYGYRMSNLLAAVGAAQIDRLEHLVQRTRAVNERYARVLKSVPGIEVIDIDHHGRGNGWLSVVLLDADLHRSPAEVRALMARDNIEARRTWKPMHLQPLYAANACSGGSHAEELFARGVCLPSGSTLTIDEQARVLESFLGAIMTGPTVDIDLSLLETSTSA